MTEPSRGITSTPLLTATQERELITRYQSYGDSAALERLVTANVRFVAEIANPYSRMYGVDAQDLQQEGLIGLLHAIDKFDLSKNYRLTTYAHAWIHQAVRRALPRHAHAVHLPDRIYDSMPRVKRSLETSGDVVALERLAAQTGESPETVEAILQWIKPVLSLDAPISSTDETPLAHFIGESDVDSVCEASTQAEQRAQVAALLETLPDERRRTIIQAYYGVCGCEKRALKQLAEEMGVSKQRVSRLNVEALEALRVAAGRRV